MKRIIISFLIILFCTGKGMKNPDISTSQGASTARCKRGALQHFKHLFIDWGTLRSQFPDGYNYFKARVSAGQEDFHQLLSYAKDQLDVKINDKELFKAWFYETILKDLPEEYEYYVHKEEEFCRTTWNYVQTFLSNKDLNPALRNTCQNLSIRLEQMPSLLEECYVKSAYLLYCNTKFINPQRISSGLKRIVRHHNANKKGISGAIVADNNKVEQSQPALPSEYHYSSTSRNKATCGFHAAYHAINSLDNKILKGITIDNFIRAWSHRLGKSEWLDLNQIYNILSEIIPDRMEQIIIIDDIEKYAKDNKVGLVIDTINTIADCRYVLSKDTADKKYIFILGSMQEKDEHKYGHWVTLEVKISGSAIRYTAKDSGTEVEVDGKEHIPGFVQKFIDTYLLGDLPIYPIDDETNKAINLCKRYIERWGTLLQGKYILESHPSQSESNHGEKVFEVHPAQIIDAMIYHMCKIQTIPSTSSPIYTTTGLLILPKFLHDAARAVLACADQEKEVRYRLFVTEEDTIGKATITLSSCQRRFFESFLIEERSVPALQLPHNEKAPQLIKEIETKIPIKNVQPSISSITKAAYPTYFDRLKNFFLRKKNLIPVVTGVAGAALGYYYSTHLSNAPIQIPQSYALGSATLIGTLAGISYLLITNT